MKKIILLGLITANVCVAAPNASELLKEAEVIRNPRLSYVSDVTVTDKRPGSIDVVRAFKVYIKDIHTSLIKFIKPEEGNRALLIGDSMWLAIKGASVLKMAPENKLAGTAAYSDLAKVTYDENYDAKSVREDTFENKKVYVLDLTIKEGKSSIYEKVDYWLEVDSKKPVRLVYKSSSGSILREAIISGYKKVEGRERPLIMILKNSLDKDLETAIEFKNPKSEILPDSMFLKANLK